MIENYRPLSLFKVGDLHNWWLTNTFLPTVYNNQSMLRVKHPEARSHYKQSFNFMQMKSDFRSDSQEERRR